MADDNDTGDQTGEDAGTLRARFETELASRDRDIAFLKAGIDTETPAGRMFSSAYQGDLTADAIKGNWAEIFPAATGAPTATADEPAPQASTAPLTALERQALLGSSRLADDASTIDIQSDVNPNHAAIGAFYDTLKSGETRDTAGAVALDMLFNAAAKGDKRVLVAEGRVGEDL